jgi:glutathione peroxidase
VNNKNYFMQNILFSLILTFTTVTSVYTLSYTDVDGNNISYSGFQGKKMLLVNIATNSPRVSQLTALQQLQQQYGDSLVIIAYPSNSFGNESRSDSAIKQFCQTIYNATFRIASKGVITGSQAQSIYSWLASSAENGAMNATVSGDFQKFLIDKQGNLVAVFSPSVSPTDSKIINAINRN